ncbi:hypothetical protein MLD38_004346 [Melastoma candidum]|uniref:Uncharacterized protein n=1 Tax=Melastoma candidum TaxID=119954 RepID=A0ACB9S5J2_9MYRT|nr:hypothetical protein MLD38_004346 [Melastoma candidum]
MKEEEGLGGDCRWGDGGDRCSRDLLQRFHLVDRNAAEKFPYKQPNEETEELELSLGLSLGGRFGIEKSSKGLARSSSVAGAIPFRVVDLSLAARTPDYLPSIIRTSSLPTETEEELKKRKEWQSLRRMEVKRRLCEKQRKGGDKDGGDEIIDQMTINIINKPEVSGSGKVPCLGMSLPSGLHGSAVTAGQGLIRFGGLGNLGSEGKKGISGVVGGVFDGSYGLAGYGMVKADGSAEFQHGGSSGSGGGSDSDGRPTQGSSTGTETKSPVSNGLLRDNSMISPAVKTPKEGMQVILPRQDAPKVEPEVQGVMSMEEMPGVFTKGDGPNGIRVDGILYKYGKGVEVRIMCVCHGKFLSPAEFVKHAGGDEVANPHRHIFIDTSTVFSR